MRAALLALALAGCSDAGGSLAQFDGTAGPGLDARGDAADAADAALACGPVGYSPGPRLLSVAVNTGVVWMIEFKIDAATGATTIMGSLLGNDGQTPVPYESNVVTAWYGCAHVSGPGVIEFATAGATMQMSSPHNTLRRQLVSLSGAVTQDAGDPLVWHLAGHVDVPEDLTSILFSGTSMSADGLPELTPRVCSNEPCHFAATCLIDGPYVRPPSCLD